MSNATLQQSREANFANGATETTNIISLDDKTLVSVFWPGNFQGNVTFLGSTKLNGVFSRVLDANQLDITLAAPASIPTDGLWVLYKPADFVGLPQYVKLRSTAAQNADRTMLVMVREVR